MANTFWNESSQAYVIGPNTQSLLAYDCLRAIYCSTWLGVMVAVGIVYYLLPSKEVKKSKLFRLQIFCIFMATSYNLSELCVSLYSIKSLFSKGEKRMDWIGFSLWKALGGHLMEHIIPLISDAALLFRLSAFFPHPLYSKRTRFFIFLPFFVLLFVRLLCSIAVAVTFLGQYLIGINWNSQSPYPNTSEPYWAWATYDDVSVTENTLGSAFCLMASSVLLYKAYKLSKTRVAGTSNQRFIKRRMKFFVEALTMCFIPPFFINIAAAIQLMGGWSKYVYFRETQTLNVNLSVIFSIAATSWNFIRENVSRPSPLVTERTQSCK